VLRAVALAPAGGQVGAAAALAEALTLAYPRLRGVFGDEGAPMSVAVDTVKKHITHIFEKPGAANRTQATARARDLGLLADAAEPPTNTRL
jgi:hypothetical protein